MEPVNTSVNESAGAAGTAPSTSLGQRASDGVHRLVDTAQSQVQSRVEQGKTQVAQSLGAVASSLRQSGSSLREQEQGTAGGYVEQVATQMERAADYLQQADTADLLRGVERFARRQPAVFIGAAFALGVLGARFLKSSRSQLGGSSQPYAPEFADREVPTTRSSGAADLVPGTSFDATLDANGNAT